MMMLESLQVNQSSTRGYWGEPTATVDWCENNYDLTHYIAEFFNTLSSLCMVFVGMFGVYMHSKGFETRFLVCFTTIIIVGIGSILFHGTLLFPLQLLDEVPMMFCVLTLCYSIVENKKKKRFGIWFPISLTIWGLVVTSIMIFSGRFHYDKKMQLIEFYIFQGSFAAMSAVFYIYIVLLIVRPRRYSPKYIKRLWLVGSLVFLIGYVGWHVDMNFCDWVNRLPHDLPNPQLHAWWHLAASYGSYAMCILAAYDRSKILGQDVCIKWAFFEILPYVHIVTLEERKKVFTKSKKKNKLVKEKRKLEFLNDDRSPDSNQEKIPLLRDSESDFSS